MLNTWTDAAKGPPYVTCAACDNMGEAGEGGRFNGVELPPVLDSDPVVA